jgi:c-di-GMP-binding flagellar brake protein YcgR
MSQTPQLRLMEKLKLTLWRDEDDEEGVTYDAAIRDIEGEAMLVDLPDSVLGLVQQLKIGAAVGVVCDRENGQLLFYPSFFGIQQGKLTGLWLKLPDDFELIQRRKYVRISLTVPLLVKGHHPPLEAGQEPEAFELKGHMMNLSGGGLRCILPSALPLGQRVEVSFKMNDKPPEFKMQALVVYVMPHVPKTQTNNPPKAIHKPSGEQVVALHFSDTPGGVQKIIIQECFRLELSRRGRDA